MDQQSGQTLDGAAAEIPTAAINNDRHARRGLQHGRESILKRVLGLQLDGDGPASPI